MDTIRLTYSAYGFGRFLKVIQAEMPADDEESTDDTAREKSGTQKMAYYVKGNTQNRDNK